LEKKIELVLCKKKYFTETKMIALGRPQRKAGKRPYAEETCADVLAESSGSSGSVGDGELCAEWSGTVPETPNSVDEAAEIHRSRAVQRDFIDLCNAQNVFDMSQANSGYGLRKGVEYQCMSIISTISCICSGFSGNNNDAQKSCFSVFIEGTKMFLHSTAQEKHAMLDAIAQKCIAFAPILAVKIRAVDRLLKAEASQNRLSATYLLRRQTLFEYKILAADIDFLGTLVERQESLKKTGGSMREMMAADKFRLFCKAMLSGPAVHAAPIAIDPQCSICRSDFCAPGMKRMTLACCNHRQSICESCFFLTSYQKSNEGMKTFSVCPFCRTEYSLYDDATAPPASQSP
jgi:hypothetical protein